MLGMARVFRGVPIDLRVHALNSVDLIQVIITRYNNSRGNQSVLVTSNAIVAKCDHSHHLDPYRIFGWP